MAWIPYLALFLPLLGFLILMTSSSRISRSQAGLIACSTVLASFLCFIYLLIQYYTQGMHIEQYVLFKWIHFGKINADFALQIDSVSLLMTLIVTGIGFLIHVYANGYMDHEEDYARFFALLNFFIFCMLLLVLASNLFLLFIGWEGVGLASYLLIGFWYTKPAAARAATKAFVINRIGDLGLILGLLLTFALFETSDFQQISQKAGEAFPKGSAVITLLTLLYFLGAVGKSAQLPLYAWLPDAMEGPTPVSALIHAATMVTAGVYLIVKLHAIFILAPLTMQVIGTIGALTALFASLCALAQTDLKRVLAYSTVSQLGLMFLAAGAGAFYSAMFHLTTHAFVKALLFLSAGNVVHMLHGETEMAKMGGLAKIFTKTHWIFLIGVLALAGLPPFATFFSKDLILEQEHLAGFHVLFYIGLAASILTGFYLMRAYVLTFMGTPSPTHLKEVSEAPAIMITPLLVLSGLTIGGGILGYTFCQYCAPLLEGFLNEVGITPAEKFLSSGFVITPETWLAVGGALLGVLAAALFYSRYRDSLGGNLQLLKNSFYLNDLYWLMIGLPLKKLSQFFSDRLEPQFFDRSATAPARGAEILSKKLQLFQSGEIRSYAAWMVIGASLLLVYFVL